MDLSVIVPIYNSRTRLDGLGKRLGYKIISSDSVYQLLPSRQKTLFSDLGAHRIRGKSQPLRLYGAVANDAADPADAANKVIHFKPGDTSA